MIRNVIFDLGGVLLTPEWDKHFQRLGFAGEQKERIQKATIRHPDWILLDKGISEEIVLKKMTEYDPGMELEIQIFMKSFRGVIRRRDYTEKWIESLKKAGLGVYVLSNFCRKAAEDNSEQMEFLSQADGVVLSYETGLVKPQKEIYQHLLRTYGLRAEECVFIDDRRDNIEGGEREGIKGILFTSRKQASAELQLLLQLDIEDIDSTDSCLTSLAGDSTI